MCLSFYPVLAGLKADLVRRKAAKVEEVEKKEHPDHEDEDADADDDAAKRLEESEEVQVRDIRYNLESLVPH